MIFTFILKKNFLQQFSSICLCSYMRLPSLINVKSLLSSRVRTLRLPLEVNIMLSFSAALCITGVRRIITGVVRIGVCYERCAQEIAWFTLTAMVTGFRHIRLWQRHHAIVALPDRTARAEHLVIAFRAAIFWLLREFAYCKTKQHSIDDLCN